jgi:hypothetical protein
MTQEEGRAEAKGREDNQEPDRIVKACDGGLCELDTHRCRQL